VARLLPRDWDGQRLLRFLAGLAMLALAFTFRAEGLPAASPVTSSVAPVTTSVAPVTSASGSAGAVEIEAARTSARPIGETGQIAEAAQIVSFAPSIAVMSGEPAGDSAVVVDGILPGAGGSRAPPRG
jgi:hypothetical protein